MRELDEVLGTRVAVDALGGDNAPGEVILGALDAAAEGIQVVLYGPAGLDTQGLPLVETTEVIEMADKPAEAVRAKPDSSLVSAVRAVADDDADAVISAGNTGAMLAAGLLWPWLSKLGLGRLPGDFRIQTGNSVFYFPLATCLLVSVVLSLILWLLRR